MVGFIVERFAYRPLRSAPRINVLITAIGVSLFLEFSGQAVFGADPKFYPQIYAPKMSFAIGNLSINPLQIVV
ncbi:branched-chain amino acid ABC transporter permease, partial [Bacillus altitudinis]